MILEFPASYFHLASGIVQVYLLYFSFYQNTTFFNHFCFIQKKKEIDSSEYTPTAGIDLGHYCIEGAGNFSIWDYAGHEEFHVTHSLFLGGDNAIFLVAYDLSKLIDTEDQEKAKKYYEKVILQTSFVLSQDLNDSM